MLSKVYSAALLGMEGRLVTVEADLGEGLPSFDMVGALSSSVREASSRVRTALKNAGFRIPPRRIVVNLAPADVRKNGTRFDLPIAAAVLSAMDVIPPEKLEGVMIAGELGLGGEIRPISGVMNLAACAREAGLTTLLVPAENAAEAASEPGLNVYGVRSLVQTAEFFRSPENFIPESASENQEKMPVSDFDFQDIKGQHAAKRAAEIAAAGMHNLLLSGPPGSGKTMLARCIPGILPEMTRAESLRVSRVYSSCGLIPEHQALITRRPFRAPHHTVTKAALIGGGAVPKPGEISLASSGILFLDEIPEMKKQTIEALRQPLEEHKIVLTRQMGSFEFPADCMIVAAMNPCPCGNYPDRNKCRCSEREILDYQRRLSQPFLDRIDLAAVMERVTYEMLEETGAESSEVIRGRVERARKMQQERFFGTEILYNSEIPGNKTEQFCILHSEEKAFMGKLFDKLQLSARSYHRILRVARTIADLEGTEKIEKKHLKEAVLYNRKEGRL